MGTGADILAGEPQHDVELNNYHRSRTSADSEQRDEKSFGIMSPFDEQEEWAKISEIMATFGTGFVRESVFVTELEKEFQARMNLNSDTGSPSVLSIVGQWLSKLNLTDYESLFINYGFDDLEFINGVIEESDLKEMGITSEHDRAIIMDAVTLLNNRVEKRPGSNVSQSVEDWLKLIHLENYADLFRRHLYTDMDRVRRVWEVELAAVLEIQKPAHRKRILASVSGGTGAQSRTNMHVRNGNGPTIDDLNKDFDTLKSNIKQLKDEIREKLPDLSQNKNGLSSPMRSSAVSTPTCGDTQVTGTNSNTTGTLKARKNRPAPPPPQRPNTISQNGSIPSENLEIRGPSELLFGVPSTLKTQWRHQPKDLVTGNVTYIANYLGSTIVKELRGTESSLKSIQKLKKVGREPRTMPDITLSISYRGVRFLNPLINEPICEHEIRNIHCACQDADDLTHFAYITKDHASHTHFCHVFCVPTMDQATEIILTLGQAFEVAYQIVLKDKLGNHPSLRSQSVNYFTNVETSAPNRNKVFNSPTRESAPNDYRYNETNQNHYQTNSNPRPKVRSKNITNPFPINANSEVSHRQPQAIPPQPPNNSRVPSYHHKSSVNSNSNTHSYSNSQSHCNTNANTRTSGISNSVKLLATHGRSHSVNEIKLNGNQNKIASNPVDDISIGVKDMQAGSRAPIALTEEL